MRYLVGFVLALAVVGSVTGCGESQCGAGCWPGAAGVLVNMDPGVRSTYDVELVLDGETGAFTCKAPVPTNPTGVAQLVVECQAFEFLIRATPASVEVSVTAQDGSWSGSAKESLEYTRSTVCGVLCPPSATLTVSGSLLTDCTGVEDGTQCMSGEREGACVGESCVPADCSGLEDETFCLIRVEVPGRCSGGRCQAECSVLPEGAACLQSVGGEMGVCKGAKCVVQNE